MPLRTVKPEALIPIRPLVVVIFGAPGICKTSITFTAPRKVLIIDGDRGIDRAHQKHRPEYVNLDLYKDYGEFRGDIFHHSFETKVREEGIRTVGIDTAGALLDNFMAPWLIKVDPSNETSMGGLSLGGWGALKVEFNNLLNRFRSLGLHVVIVAHEKMQDDKASSKYGLAVSGGSSDIIMQSADLCGYLYKHTRRGRILDFNPSYLHLGKNTGRFEELEVPGMDDAQLDNWLAGLIEQTQKHMTERSAASMQVQEMIDSITESIDKAEKPEEFDAVIATIAAVQSPLAKAQLRKRLSNALDFAGLKYSKEDAKVVPIPPPAEDATAEAAEGDPAAAPDPATDAKPAA